MHNVRVREREPVTLKLADRRLATVLQAFVIDLDLTSILRDGVLWITSSEMAENFLKTGVYDVRDLCRDADESQSLIDAITSQTKPSSWSEVGGLGAIEFARPGTLVITHQERTHMEVLDLLETYRTALRSSKPRKRAEEDPNEVTTIYYRLHANVARDLTTMLPRLVRPESWKNEKQREAPGVIYMVASIPDLSKVSDVSAIESQTKQSGALLVMERAVLILRQTREAHDEIAEVIRRLESGDTNMRGGKGGLGGGGFGGGFFSLPPCNGSKKVSGTFS